MAESLLQRALRQGSEERAYARRTDPATSWAAADSVKDITETQQKVMHVLMKYGPAHDELLIERWREEFGAWPTEASIRSRRAELRDKGFVRRTGDVAKTSANRLSDIYEVVPRTKKKVKRR